MEKKVEKVEESTHSTKGKSIKTSLAEFTTKVFRKLKKFTLYLSIGAIVLLVMYLFRYTYQTEIVDFVTHLPWILPISWVIFKVFNKARHTKADKESKLFAKDGKAGKGALRLFYFALSFVLIWFSCALMPDIYNFVRLGIHHGQLEKIALDKLPNTKYEIPFPNKAVKSYIDVKGSGDIYDCSNPRVYWVGDAPKPNERPNMKFICGLEPDPEQGLQKATKNLEEILLLDAYGNSLKVEDRVTVNTPISGTSYSAHNRPLEIIMRRLGFGKFISMKPMHFGYLPVYKDGKVIESYIVISMMKYKGFFRKPMYGGVYLIALSETTGVGNNLSKMSVGIGEYVSKEMIYTNEKYWFLKGQDLTPPEVVLYNASSFRFKDGWYAALPAVREYSHVPNNVLREANQQPYLGFYDFSSTNADVNTFYDVTREGLYDACFLEPYKNNNMQRSISLYAPVTGEDRVYYYDHMERKEDIKGVTAIESDYRSQIDDKLPEGTELIGSSEYIPAYLKEQKVFYVSNRVIHDTITNEYISQSPPRIILTPVEEDRSFDYIDGWDEDLIRKDLIERYGGLDESERVKTVDLDTIKTLIKELDEVVDSPYKFVLESDLDSNDEGVKAIELDALREKILQLELQAKKDSLEKNVKQKTNKEESIDSTKLNEMVPTVNDSLRRDSIEGGGLL